MTLTNDAIALLRRLSGPHGIHASASSTANYRAVFARDAVMAGIAGVLVGDTVVCASFARTLEHLRDLQGPQGQIASNYEIRDDAAPHVSFGTLAPRLDAATWYLVGVALGARAGLLDAVAYRDSVRSVVALLDAIEYNGRHLMYVPVGGNWADEYIYDGYVLYDQVLRAWGLRLCAAVYGESAWRDKADRIDATIDERYWPTDGEPRNHPIAAFSPTVVRDLFDLAACSLLAVANVAPTIGSRTLDGIARRFVDRDTLPPAFDPVIDEGHPDWPALQRYQLHGFRNRPHEYHNGGIWPIWLGWLALAFARAGRNDAVARLHALVTSSLDALPNFAYEEYLHGVTGAPGGTRNMAYTATGLLFLDVAVSMPDRLTLLTP